MHSSNQKAAARNVVPQAVIAPRPAILASCPFAKVSQLNRELVIEPAAASKPSSIHRTDSTAPPTLPGQPLIRLDVHDVSAHLQAEFLTPDLDALSPYLWLATTQSSACIRPLHHQIVKGRSITITEDPELHGLWAYDRLFCKPIPDYLLSYAFWEYFLGESNSALAAEGKLQLVKAMRGFLRTYVHLIKHKSDFEIASERRLIPEDVTWPAFAEFLLAIAHVTDADVSPRYLFGEMRLTRLHVLSRIFLRRLVFRNLTGQYETYFAGFYGPMLFAFGFFSIVLSSMQVILADEQVPGRSCTVPSSSTAFRQFSSGAIGFICLIGGLLILMLAVGIVRELAFALYDLYRKRQARGTLVTQRDCSLKA